MTRPEREALPSAGMQTGDGTARIRVGERRRRTELVKALVRVAFLLVASVNLAPVLGVVSVSRLEALYGIEVTGPDIEILLRHRAVLFAVVGLLLLLGAFRPALRPLAVSFGLLSMLSFVVIALLVGDHGSAVGRVVAVDVVAAVVLVAAAVGSRFSEEKIRGQRET